VGAFSRCLDAHLTNQFIIATIAYAMNERMVRRPEYLQEEVRALREALGETTVRRASRSPTSTGDGLP
jgi:hypothetical protein